MPSRLNAFPRWLAIFGLALLIAVTAPMAWILNTMGGGALTIAERAKAEMDRLVKGGAA